METAFAAFLDALWDSGVNVVLTTSFAVDPFAKDSCEGRHRQVFNVTTMKITVT